MNDKEKIEKALESINRTLHENMVNLSRGWNEIYSKRNVELKKIKEILEEED